MSEQQTHPRAAARERRGFATDLVFSLFAAFLGRARGLILFPLITRLEGVAAYGIWVQLNGVVAAMTPFAGLNLNQAIVRFAPPASPGDAAAMLRALARLSLRISIPATLLLALALLFGNEHTVQQYGGRAATGWAMCLIPISVITRLYLSFLRARNQLKLSRILDLALSFGVVIAAAVAFAYSGGLGWAMAGAVFVSLLILAAAVRASRAGKASTEQVEKVPLRSFVAYSLPTIPGALADWTLSLSDRYVLAAFTSAAVVGSYSSAYSLAQTLMLLVYPVEMVVVPSVSRLWDTERRDDALGQIANSIRFFIVGGGLLALLLSWFAEPVLTALGSSEIGAAGGKLMPVLAPGILCFGVTKLLFTVPLCDRNTRITAKIVMLSAAVNVSANLILVPQIGASGAAWSTLVCYLGSLLGALLAARRIAVVPFKVWWLVNAIASLSIAAAALWLLDAANWTGHVLACAVAVLIYGAATWLGLNHSERHAISAVIASRRAKAQV